MRLACSTTLFCLALSTALPVAADVLVTTDGTVVETQGPWEQRGKMVVFTLDNGRLSALRAEDVDFDATERWRVEIEETSGAAAAPPPKEAAKARIVLTDADVARALPDLEPATGADPAAIGATADRTASADPNADPATQSPVRVIASEDDEPADGRGRRVYGTLRNDGNSFATDVTLEVTVYDDDGVVAGTQSATVVASSLRPGESTTFSLQFTEVYVIGAVRFRVNSLDLELGGIEEDETGEL